MEGDPTAQSSQPADDTDVVAAQPEPGVSGDTTAPAVSNDVVNDVFRAAIGVRPASKPEPTEQTGVSASDQEGVKPGETTRTRGPNGRFLPSQQQQQAAAPGEQEQPQPGRRGRAAEADLREQIRQQVLEDLAREASENKDAEQAKADAERFLRLRDLPDDHPEMTADNWQWLQEQKALRANYPKAAAAIRAEADATIRAAQADISAREQAVLSDLGEQMKRTGAKYKVDFDQYRGLPSFEAMAEYLVEHATAPLLAKLSKLELERSQQLQLTGPRGLGSMRAPLAAGRSSPGAPEPNVNDTIRQAAFGRRLVS